MSTSYTKSSLLATACLSAVTMIAGAFLLSSTVSADTSVVDNVEITVPLSCTMSGTGMNSHNTEIINGNYEANIGTTTLHVLCNDAAGFAIYAAGYTGNEIGGTNSNKLVGTSASNNATIVTGLATSAGNPDVSNWAMKLAITQDSGDITGTNAFVIDSAPNETNGADATFSQYHVVPNEYTKVAHKNASTDMTTSTGGAKLTTTYAAYISRNQVADTYSGQVIYTLVHPSSAAAPMAPLSPAAAPAYSIVYAPNASDIIGDMSSLGAVTASATAGKQTKISGTSNTNISASTTEIELIAPNYARNGYGFAGWSTDFEADDNSTIYGPNETITITAGSLSPNGLILYPVWVASAGDMQEWTGCSSMSATTYNSSTGKVSVALSQITALTDTRDNNVYTVAKLADGKCWMVENLRLNNDHTTSSTDIAKSQGYYTYPGSGTNYGSFIGLADSEDANFNSTAPTAANNAANDFYSSDGSTIINIGSIDSSSRIPRYNNNNTDMVDNASNSTGTTLVDSRDAKTNYARWFSYGNYYNWPAAMASTNRYVAYSGADGSDVAGTSICPKGWELPLGFESTGTLEDGASDATNRVGSFSFLDRMMGGTGQRQSSTSGIAQSTKWRFFPNNFVYSGFFSTTFAENRCWVGHYWTSSVSDASNANRFYLVSDTVIFTYTNAKQHGSSVRCIAQ